MPKNQQIFLNGTPERLATEISAKFIKSNNSKAQNIYPNQDLMNKNQKIKKKQKQA